MSRLPWNERDAAQALLASYRNDYDLPGRKCSECHCEDCLTLTAKKPCCTLATLLLQAEEIVKQARAARKGERG